MPTPKEVCIERVKELRDLFAKYVPDSKFATLTDKQIRKNVNNRFELYQKANEYIQSEKKYDENRVKFIPDKNVPVKRIHSFNFPVDDIEKQNKIAEAFNGNNLKNKLTVVKDMLDDVLNINISEFSEAYFDPKKCIEKTLQYKEQLQNGWITKDLMDYLNANKNTLQLPPDYVKQIKQASTCYQSLVNLTSQTIVMGSYFNFLVNGKNEMLGFTKTQLQDVSNLFLKAQNDGHPITNYDLIKARQNIEAGCTITMYNEDFDFYQNIEGFPGRTCDYKLEDANDKTSLYNAISQKKKIVKKSEAEIENGVGFNSNYYKNLWNRTRCAKFNNFTNEINNTNEFNEDNIDKQLRRFAMLSKINNEHKKDFSGWDYIHPIGWHKRNRYRKEKECLDNMKNTLLRKGYPNNLLNRIQQRGDVYCVTPRMLGDLPNYIRNNAANQNNRPEFNLDSYISNEVRNTYNSDEVTQIREANNDNHIDNEPLISQANVVENNNANNANQQVNANQNNIENNNQNNINNINNINNLNNAQNNNNPVIGNMNVQNNNENIIEINTNMNQQNNNSNIINTNTSGNNNPTNRVQNNKSSVYKLSGRNSSQRSKSRPLSTLQAAERKQMRQGVRNQKDTNKETYVPTNERTNNN